MAERLIAPASIEDHGLAMCRSLEGSFIGRQAELTRIEGLITDESARMITLTGPSGVGKTRLALAAAARLAPWFHDRVWVVELGAVEDPALVGQSIASAIGAPQTGATSPEDAIAAHVGDSRTLLLLDSFEQVLAGASLVASLLMRTPDLHIVATSQSPLRLSGEHQIAVGPLPVPLERSTSIQSLERTDATALFLQRARAAQQGYGAHEQDAPCIAEITRRLDGIPLAIELAASRANALSPQLLLERLDEGLLDLADESDYRPTRQRTLRAAIAWSHGLLAEPEKIVFRRLAVFQGGFDLQAAQQVAGVDPLTFLEALSALVDRSLIRRVTSSSERERFGMLTAPRAFALEALAAAGEDVVTRKAHLDWLRDIALASETALVGPDQAAWVQRLNSEQGNIRAALRWAIDQGLTVEAMQIAAALWRYWATVGLLAEARAWLSATLELPGAASPDLRAKASHHLGNVELDMGDFASARLHYDQGLALTKPLNDRLAEARSHNGLGLVGYFQGRYDDAQHCHLAALELRRAENEPSMIALSLSNLGDVELALGKTDEARVHQEAALAIRRQLGDRNGTGYSLHNLGVIDLAERKIDSAIARLEEARAIMEETSDKPGTAYARVALARAYRLQGDARRAAETLHEGLRLRIAIGDLWGIIDCLEVAGTIAFLARRDADAAWLFGAATAHRGRIGADQPPFEKAEREEIERALERALRGAAFDETIQAGAEAPVSRAIERAQEILADVRAAGVTRSRTARTNQGSGRLAGILSTREQEVLRLAARGLTDQEIADSLGLSRRTVTTHQANIRQKLDVQNRAEAVARATREGLI
jgi:predicted ATPase/DNA-binding CsgD family transcriptional regulator